MNDQLTELYLEKVVKNPKAATSGNKKSRAGNMEAGQDFGFNEKGTQKGTGPESVKGLQKPKKAAKTLTEDTEDDKDTDTGTEETGTQSTTLGSKFDELFSSTITEEFGEAGPNMSFGGPDADSDMGDVPSDDMPGDDTGEEVSLKSELSLLVSRLQEIIDNIESDDDEMGGDEEGGDIKGLEASNDMNAHERPFGEASANAQGKGDPAMDMKRDGVMRKAKDFDKKFQNPKGDNKVSGYYGQKTMKGSEGDAGMDKPRDGVLRKAPDFDKGLQGKNNKVSTNSVMSKPGANLFD